MTGGSKLAAALFRTSWLRSIVTVVSVGAAVALVAGVLLLMHTFRASADDQIDGVFSQADLVVSSATGTALDSHLVDELAETDSIASVIPYGQFEGTIDQQRALVVVLPTVEGQARELLGRPDEGRVPLAASSRLLSESGLSEHDPVTLGLGPKRMPAVVAGTPDSVGQSELDRATYVVTSASALPRGLRAAVRPNVALVELGGGADRSVVDRIADRYTGVVVQDRAQATDALLAGLASLLDNLPLVALVALLLGVVLVFTVVRAATITERRSLLLLRAIGAPNATIRRLAVFSALAHGLGGVVLGLAASGGVAGQLLNSVPASLRNSTATVLAIELDPVRLAAVAVVVLVVCALAAWLATRPLLTTPTEDQLRESGPVTGPLPQLAALLAGLALLGVGVAAILFAPGRLWTVAVVAIMVSWLLLGFVAIPRLLALVARAVRGTRPGFITRAGTGEAAGVVRAGALVVSGAVALVVALSGTAVNLEESARPTLAGMDRIDLMVQDVPVDDLPTNRSLSAGFGDRLGNEPGVTEVRPIQMGYVTVRGVRLLAQGLTADSLLPVAVQGRERFGPLAPGEVYVSTQAEHSIGARRGKTFTLPSADGGRLRLRVAGTVQSFLWPEGLLVLNVEDSQRLWGHDTLSAYELGVAGGDVRDVRRRLLSEHSSRWPDLVVATGPMQAAQAEQVVADSSALYRALSLMALVVAVLIGSSAVGLDTMARVREFGTVRALGGRRRLVSAMILVRSLTLVLAGCLAGLVFGELLQVVLARISSRAQGLPVEVHWGAVPVASGLGAGLVVVVVAAGVSVWRLRRIPVPDMVTAGE